MMVGDTSINVGPLALYADARCRPVRGTWHMTHTATIWSKRMRDFFKSCQLVGQLGWPLENTQSSLRSQINQSINLDFIPPRSSPSSRVTDTLPEFIALARIISRCRQ
jgi:hypothetical protein